MIYYTGRHSCVCSKAFSLERFVHYSAAPLFVLVCSWVRRISIGPRFSRQIGFLSPLKVWSHRCIKCNRSGRVEQEVAAELSKIRTGGGGERRNLASAKHRFIYVLSSSFSLCGIVFSLRLFYLFPTPFLLPYSVFVLVRLCLNVCVCVNHCGIQSGIMSHLSSLLSPPQGTGELFARQYSLTLQTMATESAYCVFLLCPIDDIDLYLCCLIPLWLWTKLIIRPLDI